MTRRHCLLVAPLVAVFAFGCTSPPPEVAEAGKAAPAPTPATPKKSTSKRPPKVGAGPTGPTDVIP
jgi:hypothetical protein